MSKLEDYILDILADMIARFLITGFVVLLFLRLFWREIFIREHISWSEALVAAGLIGFLVSLTAIRKGPGAI